VLGIRPQPRSHVGPLDARLARVRAVVADAPASVDEIVRQTDLEAAHVAAAVAELELLGVIVQSEGRYREVTATA
jgi:predicted Rossmann fold nucleotide-binding protein DprA/Smf involved in DNA uptake